MLNDQASNTSGVLLGFLESHSRSGYDIKSVADHSTRFFWQISYGQIYPELKRLVELGLAVRQTRSRGGRTRNEYRITARGREALRAWLTASNPAAWFEMRDEMLLKLFFSDAVGTGAKRHILKQIQAREEAVIAKLRALEPHAREKRAGHVPAQLDVLLGGIKIHETYLNHVKELQKNHQNPAP